MLGENCLQRCTSGTSWCSPRSSSHSGPVSGTLKLHLQPWLSRESGWLPRSGPTALLVLLLLVCKAICAHRRVRDTLSARNAWPCSISTPLPLREAAAAWPWVGARTYLSSRTGQTRHAVCRAARRFAATEKACVPVLWRGFPFSKQTAPEGLWVGRCLSKHSLSHHQLCLAVGVFLQYRKLSPWLPPPQKRALDSRGSRLRAQSQLMLREVALIPQAAS